MENYFKQFGEIESIPLSKFQRIVARRLHQSWSAIPHVTHFDKIDVTELEQYRANMPQGHRPSPVIFLAKALAEALKVFPTFNTSLSEDGSSLICKKYFHIGIAVDGPLGLLVPVLRDVDQKDHATLAAELTAFVKQAREKGLPMDAMSGGSMTITSLGGIGGSGFTPIINQPEVAILGVNPNFVGPVWDGKSFLPRTFMPVSLSYDHRVINGADAARFARSLERLMSPAPGWSA